MAYFTAYFQKKALSFAISQLGLFEQDAFDFDNQGISWGSTTTVELRDVPLSIPRLTELLRLPPSISLTESRVSLLRLTLPLNFVSNSVAVEIEGIKVKLLISQSSEKALGNQRKENKSGLARGVKANFPRTSDNLEDTSAGLPTPDDLAGSFLASQSPRDKAEIRSAIARSKDHKDRYDPDETSNVGLGPDVSLKAFFSNLAKGVLDRFKASIKDIQIEATFKLPLTSGNGIEHSQSPEDITFCLDVASIDIPPVSQTPQSSNPEQLPVGDGFWVRTLTISGIHGSLLSTSALSSFMTQLSRPASPTLSRAASKVSDATSSPELSSRRSRFKNSFRSVDAKETASRTQSENSFQSFEQSRASLPSRIGQFDRSSTHASFRRSLIDEVEDQLPVSFGEDSQALSESEILDLHRGSSTLNRLGSDLNDSALSESSQSFLCRSPVQQFNPGSLGARSSSRSQTKHSGSSTHSTEAPIFHPMALPEEDLTTSRFFSAAEAKSIYMSAMGEDSGQSDLPGGREDSDSDRLQSDSPTDVFHDASTGTQYQSSVLQVEPKSDPLSASHSPFQKAVSTPVAEEFSDDDSPPASLLVSNYIPESTEEPALTENREPLQNQQSIQETSAEEIPVGDSQAQQDDTSPMASSTPVKTLFMVDTIQIQIPPSISAAVVADLHQAVPTASNDLPGAFSTYSSLDTSIDASAEYAGDTTQLPFTKEQPQGDAKIVVSIMHVVFCFDMALLRLLVPIVNHLTSIPPDSTSREVERKSSATDHHFGLNIRRFILRFEETLRTHPRLSFSARSDFITEAFSMSSDDLIRLFIEDFQLSAKTIKHEVVTEVLVAKLVVGFTDENIVSFNRDLKMRESVRDALIPSGQDISIQIVRTESSIISLDINSAPLHLNANVNRLSELINWLGGLSTVIDLGNSVKSNMTVKESPTAPTRGRPRGVHFDVTESASATDMQSKPSPKINLRIGGLAVDIIGRDAAVLIEGSALKVVFRDGAIRTQIDRINIYGPLLRGDEADPAFLLSIDTLAIAYFGLPKENDLTRLLALLSPPSQERDEQEDDILLDTLLRQRRKGGVLRVSITRANARISRVQNFHHFTALGEELSQLSSVAKYLPEDDKPGLLILIALDTVQTEAEINQHITSLSFSIRDIQLAMVTFPSLFLMSIGNINATHAGMDIIGQATPDLRRNLTRQNLSSEDTPRLSIRFVAGEMEPTVKLKLYNLRFEYHVSTVMAFLGISETASGEVIVAEMVNTVANLTSAETALGRSLLFSPEEISVKTRRPFRIDITVRDTTIGLNPRGKPAQGLLVLTKCRVTAIHAEEPKSNGHGLFEITKGCFMVIDNKDALLSPDDATDPNIVSGLGTKPTQIQCLEAIGYISIGQTSAAKITARLKETATGPLLDVEVRNDLLVLETCADSTQTLLSVMGGLSPPMPPHKGDRYRTEVVPIGDMLASFSGHAFSADTIEEDDTDYTASSDDGTGTIALDEGDDRSLDFGLNEDEDFPHSLADRADPSATSFGLASVIFRQPNEATPSMNSNLASFQEEAHVNSSLHFDDGHFGKTGEGQAKEWNSYKNTYDAANPAKIKESPLQIHFEDIHFIWNLYDGYDWQKTRDTISQAVDDIEAKAEDRRVARRDKLRNVEDDETEVVIGDMLFNSIYIGISTKDDPRDLSRRVNGILNDDSSETGSYATTTTLSATPSRQGPPRTRKKRLRLGRSRHHKMTFELKGVSGNIISFPPDSGETQSSIDIRIRDIEVFDNVPTSTWKKFATYMHDAGNRQLGSSMVHLEMLVVKPDQDLLASEFVLKISVLPLRLHVDQDALDFMTRFFEFRDDADSNKAPASNEIPFIQRAEVGPVQVKLDFKPKRVDWKALRSGRTAEFMNFIILDEADMILRRIILYGVRGFDKLGQSLNDIWTPDVKTNQLPGVLAGLAPVRPLVNVGLGVRDLVVIPMREYRKDGRLVRAVRKGVVSFGKTTTTELAKLGAKLAIGTHTMLSGAEGILSPDSRGPTSRDGELDSTALEEQPTLSPYADQPIGVVQGLRGAYRGLERDLLLAKDAIVAMPGEVMESQNASEAAAAFLRTAPVVILRPAMGITKAVGQTLMGATNSLDKAERRRIEDKYKHR